MKKVARKEQTRERVLEVAARQFRERGYAGVSLRSIAEEAGMQAGSLYYHFESKEDLVVAVLDRGIAVVLEAVQEATHALPRDTDASTLLGTAIREHLRTFHAHGDFTSANVRIFGQVPATVRGANLAMRRKYDELWKQILRRASLNKGLRQGLDLDATRLLLIGAMNATLDWFDPRRGGIDDLARRYADIVLNGTLADRSVS
jgi:AcrR family transcriptional regulator